MTFGKRQFLVGALVVALGAAVYLNWQFSSSGADSDPAVPTSADSSKQLGQTVYVNTEVSGAEKNSTKANTDSTKNTAKKVSAEVSAQPEEKQKSYFTSEREKREKAHSDALEGLTEIAQSPDSSESAKQEAAKAAESLSKAIKAECDMESEILTKGFDDCLVCINQDTCTVIVNQKNLNDATAITIKDIVNRQSGIAFDKITITAYTSEK